ncbi:hypothetical protein LUW75_10710 [Streptomyces sp. MRC013]|uniref:hypothetical protein n=1 Tax=Streptomyces sp. MRC013 TaxID=2898276 RepID=UPI002026AC0A|nr:hypothetical protein [Streptomyces sp. MRC013]URM90385.1 hypothetical protein LUW75_10710 [Streptomyces sp. MRC013]
MTSTTALPLFGEDNTQTEAETRPPENLGMAATTARLVVCRNSRNEDGEPLALLVADCPFCDHQHIHPAGTAAAPRVCLRRSRCVGRPTGVYYFPAVHQ